MRGSVWRFNQLSRQDMILDVGKVVIDEPPKGKVIAELRYSVYADQSSQGRKDGAGLRFPRPGSGFRVGRGVGAQMARGFQDNVFTECCISNGPFTRDIVELSRKIIRGATSRRFCLNMPREVYNGMLYCCFVTQLEVIDREFPVVFPRAEKPDAVSDFDVVFSRLMIPHGKVRAGRETILENASSKCVAICPRLQGRIFRPSLPRSKQPRHMGMRSHWRTLMTANESTRWIATQFD